MSKYNIEEAKDLFDLFIYEMAEGAGDAKQRIMESEISLIKINSVTIPPALMARFTNVWNKLNEKGLPKVAPSAPGCTALIKTVSRMENSTVSKLMKQLVSIRASLEMLDDEYVEE